VEDTARLLHEAARLDLPAGTVVNVASGRETSVIDIVTGLCRLFEVPADVVHEPQRAADVRRHWADTSLAQRLVPGAANLVPLDEGLRRTVEWYLGTP
jgi:UDP-glucose 4-epimerase